MHLQMSAALNSKPFIEVPKATALSSHNIATWSLAVQSRLQQLQINHDPSDSELLSFLEWSDQVRGNEIRTYFLIGNYWMKPTSTLRAVYVIIHALSNLTDLGTDSSATSWVGCCWGDLSQDQYHRHAMLAIAERIPISVLNRLSMIARHMFKNDENEQGCHNLHSRWNLCDLQLTFEVGTIDYYCEGGPTFKFNQGFKAELLTSPNDADDSTVKGQGRQGESPRVNLPSGGIDANQANSTPKQGSACLLRDAAAGARQLDKLSLQALALEAQFSILSLLQAAGVCKWATYLHFLLTPLAQEVGNLRPHQAPNHLGSVRATHCAVAMSGLSAIATLDPSQANQQEQANCNTDASSLQQQLSSGSIPVPQLQQQAPPQPEVDSTHQHADLSSGTSAAGIGAPTSVLQVNTREVLGCGSTGVIFAGQFQGQEVAVKVSQPYYEVREQRNKEDKFLSEVWMYQQLQQMPEIYGTLVPELLAFVHLPHQVCILVMTKEGRSLSNCVDENGKLPESLKETVLSSLTRLHNHGVVHGSPRFDNITLKPGSSDVCFIDLQRAGCHKYAWPRPDSLGDKWDSSLEDWRELTSAEALDEGAHSLASDMMTAVKLKLQEYRYVCMLLEQDYTETGDCTTFQRASFKVDYHLGTAFAN